MSIYERVMRTMERMRRMRRMRKQGGMAWRDTRGKDKKAKSVGQMANAKRRKDNKARSMRRYGERKDEEMRLLSRKIETTETRSWPGAEPRWQIHEILIILPLESLNGRARQASSRHT